MSKENKKFKLLFVFTGSIAVYKAVTVLSRLVQKGYDVECVLTRSALRFIGLSTIEGLIGKKAHVDLYDSDNVMSHIHLIRDADAVLVAPATASFINKMASGIADDLASTLYLAHDFKKPFIVAPAMNTKMYEHPQTQRSVNHLKSIGVSILEAGSGILACGEIGYGKLLEPEIMLVEINRLLTSIGTADKPAISQRTHFERSRVLITGGGTTEPIDDVRSLTNSSTGETAILIASRLFDLGLSITLVINNSTNLTIPDGIEVIAFTSFKDLHSILKSALSEKHFDFVVHAAAVSDFSLDKIEGLKPKTSAKKISSEKPIKLVLKPNFKIISKLASYSMNKKINIVGFKLTSHAGIKGVQSAVKKVFENSNVNFVVQNDISQIDRTKGDHRFSLFAKNGNPAKSLDSKDQLINQLANLILAEAK